ncbi:MAG: hypothetical protein BWY82_02456 [Verrucomicrobia bacterium ADurb.Bin474]|nr:MAG: hypothetical protein BWY82_02456 [Verrucomicrobia bacterium ADurb.Bin474]
MFTSMDAGSTSRYKNAIGYRPLGMCVWQASVRANPKVLDSTGRPLTIVTMS